MNPNILSLTGQPCCPFDQGSIEGMNQLVKRIIGIVPTKQRLVADNPNWTQVLGLVTTVINSQHGHRKDDISSYEAIMVNNQP